MKRVKYLLNRRWSMSDLKTFMDILTNPTSFFEDLSKRRHDYMTPYSFYVKILVLFLVIDLILELIGIQYNVSNLQGSSTIYITFFYLFSLVTVFISPFISAAFTHLGLMLIAKKKDFLKTFNAVVYSDVILGPYMVLLTFVSILLYLTLGTDDTGLILVGLFTLLLWFAQLGHVIALEVIALKRMYQITTGKAILSIVIVPIILFFIVLLIALFFIISIGLLAAL